MNCVNFCFENVAKCFRGASLCRFIVSLLLFVFALMPVHAQTTNGIFTGTVTDPQGASVANADVVITNLGTNATTTAKTNAEGLYRIPDLPVGAYKFTVSGTGVKKAVTSGIHIRSGVVGHADFKLD